MYYINSDNTISDSSFLKTEIDLKDVCKYTIG